MKRLLSLIALSLPLGLAACAHRTTVAYYPPPPPPAEFTQIAQRGFHDGFAAAQHDVRNNRPPDFAHHPRFRNPPVPPPAVEDYRRGFRRGYEDFLHNSPPPRM